MHYSKKDRHGIGDCLSERELERTRGSWAKASQAERPFHAKALGQEERVHLSNQKKACVVERQLTM